MSHLVREVESEIVTSKEKLEQANRRLQSENGKLLSDIDLLAAQSRELSDTNHDLNEEVARLNQEITNLIQDKFQEQKRKESAQQRAEQLRSEVNSVEADRTSEGYQQLLADYERTKDDLHNMKENYARAQSDMRRQQGDIARLQDRLSHNGVPQTSMGYAEEIISSHTKQFTSIDLIPEQKHNQHDRATSMVESEVSVAQPETRGEGVKAYTVYKVISKSNHRNIVEVERRYSDFYWLQQRLFKAVKGVIIPPLPPKTVIGRFKPDFIEFRRRHLESFLARIVHHDLLCDHPDLNSFLRDDDVAFAATKQHKITEEKEFGERIKEFQTVVSNKFGSGKNRVKSFDDVKIEAADEYSKELHRTLSKVHSSSKTVISRTRELAQAWFDFGVSFSVLGQFEKTEDSNEGLGELLTQWAERADKLALIYTDNAEKEDRLFQEPIQDYVRVVESVQKMIKSREASLISYQTCNLELEEAKKKYADIQFDNAKQERALELQSEIPLLESKLEGAQSNLEKITQRCLLEMARFKKEKIHDLKSVVQNVVSLQINHAKNVEETWNALRTISS